MFSQNNLTNIDSNWCAKTNGPQLKNRQKNRLIFLLNCGLFVLFLLCICTFVFSSKMVYNSLFQINAPGFNALLDFEGRVYHRVEEEQHVSLERQVGLVVPEHLH